MEKRLAEVLKRLRELAFKADISAEETAEMQALNLEKTQLESQIAIQAEITADDEAARAAEVSAEVEAKLEELGFTRDKEGNLVAPVVEPVDEDEEVPTPGTKRPVAPVAGSEASPLRIKVGSPYDRLSTMDLCVRYELMKSYGKRPSKRFWTALAERAVDMSREEDTLYIENGQPVKAPAIDWEVLVPRDLDLSESAEENLFGVKAGDIQRYMNSDPSALSSDPVTPTGVRQIHAIATKANELIYSTQASAGDEWVPTLMNAQLWRTIRLNAAVLPLFQQFDMPSQPFDYPIESTDPVFYLVGEATGEAQLILTGGPFADSKIGTGKKTFSANKLGALSYWSEEMEEDSIIATEPQLRDQYGLGFAHDLDKVLISGDETTATTNIFANGATNTTASNLVLDGLRHEPLVTTTADKRDGGALTIDDFGATQALMGTAGKFGVNPADLIFLSDPAVWHKAKLLGEVLTVDKFGPMATVRTGQLAAIFGSPYIISEDYGLTDTSGNIHTTAGNNTKGSFLCINRRGVLVGWRRRPRVRVFGIPGAESRAIIGSARLDMQFKEAGMVAASYNLTV